MTGIVQGLVGTRTLRLVGLGHATTDRTGPALLAAPEWTVAVAVTDDDGAPVTGIASQGFSVTAVIARRHGAGAVTVPISATSEPVPGVYVLQLDRETVGRLAGASIPCVIDVRSRGDDAAPRGRTLVQLGD